jgi:hypothetical protein
MARDEVDARTHWPVSKEIRLAGNRVGISCIVLACGQPRVVVHQSSLASTMDGRGYS